VGLRRFPESGNSSKLNSSDARFGQPPSQWVPKRTADTASPSPVHGYYWTSHKVRTSMRNSSRKRTWPKRICNAQQHRTRHSAAVSQTRTRNISAWRYVSYNKSLNAEQEPNKCESLQKHRSISIGLLRLSLECPNARQVASPVNHLQRPCLHASSNLAPGHDIIIPQEHVYSSGTSMLFSSPSASPLLTFFPVFLIVFKTVS
jgi:hypothetical protein